jgi:hypothetical protein
MNAKFRAKHPLGPVIVLATALAPVLVLTASLAPVRVLADDAGLAQQLRVQQQKSSFQLMLEQIEQRARRRAEGHETPAFPAPASTPIDLGVATESMRLNSISVSDPPSLQIDQEDTAQLRAEQAYDRDQQRILDYRQQRRALIGPRSGSAIGVDSFATNRNELVRFSTQSQKQSLQRKLRH